MSPTPGQSGSSEPRPYVEASVLVEHLPTIRGWQRVTAYPMLKSGRVMSDSTAAHAHYRQGEHVVVLGISDAGPTMAALMPRFDAPPPAMTDEEGGITAFHRVGELWLTEQRYGEPFRERVVPYFSYNMRLPDEAQPLTPGLATRVSLVLPNGLIVSAGGPKDTPPELVRRVFDAIDRQKLMRLAPAAPAKP